MSISKLRWLKPRALIGFSIPEVIIALSIGAMAVAGGMALNQQQLRLVKSSRESNGASLALEERIEQLRIATWRQITDAEYLRTNYFGSRPRSANSLGNLSERISVTPFPDESASTGILLERAPSGQVTVLLSGSGLSDQRLAKVAVQVTWHGKDSRVRTRELATVISNAGISRMNLPAMGTNSMPGGGTTPTSPITSPTPAPAATPSPGATPQPIHDDNGNGKGRGNVGGKSGKN
jgi:type II secretory pathway component PulJ